MKKLMPVALFWLSLLSVSLLVSNSFAQGTAFTYQGRLDSSGNPASGSYDFRFRLSADAAGNTILAAAFTNGLPVANGLFAATLDFGAGFFNGSNYWLEVDVRTNGAVTYVGLTPLQALTPTPYAQFANTANNLSGALPAGQISGTIAPASFSGTYGNALTLSNANDAFSGTFSGVGANVSGVNAASLNGLNKTNFWQTGGNGGTSAGVNFLGTTDDQPLEFWVNNTRGLRLESGLADAPVGGAPPGLQGAPSLAGGLNQNSISAGVQGATIAGGGDVEFIGAGPSSLTNFAPNTITGQFGSADGATISGGMGNSVTAARAATVSGGENNAANSQHAVVAGGNSNTASGDSASVGGGQNNQANGRRAAVPGGDSNIAVGKESLAAGRGAQANFDGDFVWSDSFGQAISVVNFPATGIDQFLIRAGGGVGINTNNPGTNALLVNGSVQITGGLSVGDGSSSTGVALLNSANAFSAASNTFSGKVGIGTTTPTSTLAVNGNIFMGTQRNNNVFTQVGDTIYLGAEQKYLGNTLKTAIGGSTDWINLMANGISAGILFGTSGPSTTDPHTGASALMVIKPNGLVGIGTATPAKQLDVTGFASGVGAGGSVESSVLVRLNNTNSDGTVSSPDCVGIGFGQNSTRQAIVGGTFGNDMLDFYTGGTLTSPKMRIDFNGRVGIGTNTPAVKLDVAGDINENGKSVPEGEEKLRILRGVVQSTGTVAAISGTGWTVARTPGGASTGDYTITFNTSFGDTPAVTVTPVNPAHATSCTIVSLGSSSFRVDQVVGGFNDDGASFAFTAIGGR
jgi:hypothetical protein